MSKMSSAVETVVSCFLIIGIQRAFQAHNATDIKVYERPLFERLKEEVDVNKIRMGLEDPIDVANITPENVSTWFYEGNANVWDILPEDSLYIFSLKNPIRILFVNILLNEWFDRFLLMAIITNAIFLAANNPLKDNNTRLFYDAELCFNSIFFVEFVIKIVAMSANGYPAGYFRDPWNRLDFSVLWILWIPFFLTLLNLYEINNFSFVRTIRVLKALKTVNNVPGMKRLVNAVLNAGPRLMSVLYLLSFIFLVFGVLGTQIFMGKLRHECFAMDDNGGAYIPNEGFLCSLSDQFGQECPHDAPICSATNPVTGVLNNNAQQFHHFDNTAISFLTIFQIITLEGWSDIMYDMIAADGFACCIYFVVLIVVGAYFVINLTIAVIYQAYVDTLDNEMILKNSALLIRKSAKISPPSLLKIMYQLKLIPQEIYAFFAMEDGWYSGVRKSIRKMVDSYYFGTVTLLVILFNIIILAIEANGVSDNALVIINISNLVCTLLFIIELVLRIIAVGVLKFFTVGFNAFDSFIVFVSVLQYFISQNSASLSAFRALRILRTFKLINQWKSLQQLVKAVLKSGPGLGYFCLILMLYLFVCTLAGISLFAGKLSDPSLQFGHTYNNYDSLFNGFITTFQVVTGENWNDILYRSMEVYPVVGAIYFVMVYATGNMVVLNLFLAILLENFSDNRNASESSYYEVLESGGDIQYVIDILTPYYRRIAGHVLHVTKIIERFVLVTVLRLQVQDDTNDEDEEEDDKSNQSVVSLSELIFAKDFPDASFDDEIGKNESLSMFLNDDNKRRKVLGKISLGKYRKGNQYFSDCFLACELVDTLMDQEIVQSVVTAEKVGQELIAKRKIIPLYLEESHTETEVEKGSGGSKSREETLSALAGRPADQPNDTETTHSGGSSESHSGKPVTRHIGSKQASVNSSFGAAASLGEMSSMNTPVVEDDLSKLSPVKRTLSHQVTKIRSNLETHFRDDRSLYRLCDQGEQVTEWLLSSQESEKRMEMFHQSKRRREKVEMLKGKSFWVMGCNNPVRICCADLIMHTHFEHVVLVMIVISSLMLALDEPGISPTSQKAAFLRFADIGFTSFFGLEMIIKMVAMGALSATPKSYLRNGWNVLDFVVVFISVISLALAGLDLSFLKALRTLRCLRPLRVISRAEGMRTSINAIIITAVPLSNFMLVASIFLFAFAILGSSLFRDKFNYCHAHMIDGFFDDPSMEDEFRYVLDRDQCIGTTVNAAGITVRLAWEAVSENFDSVARSFLTLINLTSMENWPGIMRPGLDIVGDGKHPVINNTPYNSIYFVGFIVIGAYFITNLFVGIIVHKFNCAKRIENKSVFLTQIQQDWLNDLQVALLAKPSSKSPIPNADEYFGLKRLCYLIVMDNRFQVFMDMVIIVNIFVLALVHYNQSNEFTKVLNKFSIAFAVIFTVEIVMRFIAIKFRLFIKDPWNIFDSIIVGGAILDILGQSLVIKLTILRILRVGRMLKLLKNNKNLSILLKTLLFSVPSLLNVGSLLLLIFFVFSVMGMNFFGDVPMDGVWLTKYNNFEHFGTSMLLLFRCMTGENWNSIMFYLYHQGKYVAIPYFILFLVSCTYIMINLFIAVIIGNFEVAIRPDPEKVQQKHLEDFVEMWSRIHDDVGADDKDRLPCYTLIKLLHLLEPPLGIKGMAEVELAKGDAGQRQLHRQFVLTVVRSLDLKEDSKGRVYFVDVLAALVRRIQAKKSGENLLQSMTVKQKHELLYRIKMLSNTKSLKKLESKMENEVFTEVDLTVEVNCALAVQKMWRSKKMSSKLQAMLNEMHQKQSESDSSQSKHGFGFLSNFVANRVYPFSLRSQSSSAIVMESQNLEVKGSMYRRMQSDGGEDTATKPQRAPLRRLSSMITYLNPNRHGSVVKKELPDIFKREDESSSNTFDVELMQRTYSVVESKIDEATLQKEDHNDIVDRPPVMLTAVSKTHNQSFESTESWLPSLPSKLNNGALTRSVHREASQVSFLSAASAVSAMTKSSWENSVDRQIQDFTPSLETRSEELYVHDELNIKRTASGKMPPNKNLKTLSPPHSPQSWKSQSQFFDRDDSHSHWPVLASTSTKNLMEDRKLLIVENASPVVRSKTLSSMQANLGDLQLTQKDFGSRQLESNDGQLGPSSPGPNRSLNHTILMPKRSDESNCISSDMFHVGSNPQSTESKTQSSSVVASISDLASSAVIGDFSRSTFSKTASSSDVDMRIQLSHNDDEPYLRVNINEDDEDDEDDE